MKAAAIALVLAACLPERPAQTLPPPDVAASASAPATTFGPGPNSAVVALAPGTPTAILVGPFRVTAVNPGTAIELSLVTGGACTSRALWFEYSGGGLAIGAGQVLCARNLMPTTVVHAFSGEGGAAPPASAP